MSASPQPLQKILQDDMRHVSIEGAAIPYRKKIYKLPELGFLGPYAIFSVEILDFKEQALELVRGSTPVSGTPPFCILMVAWAPLGPSARSSLKNAQPEQLLVCRVTI